MYRHLPDAWTREASSGPECGKLDGGATDERRVPVRTEWDVGTIGSCEIAAVVVEDVAVAVHVWRSNVFRDHLCSEVHAFVSSSVDDESDILIEVAGSVRAGLRVVDRRRRSAVGSNAEDDDHDLIVSL